MESRLVHVLHVRKTGGMAMRAALEPVAAAFDIVLHRHETTLADVPPGERVIFTVRDPVARFVSGFNGRLRKGRPLLNNEWSEGEAKAFARFKTPNELAEAIASPHERTRADALSAMREIRHVNAPLTHWLGSAQNVSARLDDIVWIAFTETLTADFQEIKRRLNLPARVSLPRDEVLSHQTPAAFSTDLSAPGRTNIAHWYAADYTLLAYVLDAKRVLVTQSSEIAGGGRAAGISG